MAFFFYAPLRHSRGSEANEESAAALHFTAYAYFYYLSAKMSLLFAVF
jgi:hypothetical protein